MGSSHAAFYLFRHEVPVVNLPNTTAAHSLSAEATFEVGQAINSMKDASLERGVLVLVRTTEGSRFVVVKSQSDE